MPFPEVKRVIYKKNPLDRVICQLRFPPILRIDAEIPAAFQEQIRKDYPNFGETSELEIQLPKGLRGQIPSDVLRQALQSSGSKNYEFVSEDGQWKTNLTRTFIALTASNYERWEEFKAQLERPLAALIDVYTPTNFTRIGLRYIDVIRRSVLGLDQVGWEHLLQPYVLGILGAPDVGKHVESFESRYEIRLADEKGVAKVVTRFVEHADDGEICYMIDSDFYDTSKTGIDQAIPRLDYFNKRSSRLIQWCVTGLLHQAMEPETL